MINSIQNFVRGPLQMSERHVPIEKNEMSILDSEFSSIRERFESEMRKMEDEMARFRSMVLDHEKNVFNNAIVAGTVSHRRNLHSGRFIESSRSLCSVVEVCLNIVMNV